MQKLAIFKKSHALNDKHTDSKVYWTALNNFLNNIKIPSVPPILKSGGTITNIVEKANIFNDFLLPSVIFLWKTIANEYRQTFKHSFH